MALALYILAYIIYIIKEVAKSIKHRIGLSLILGSLRIGENLYAVVLNMNINLAIGHNRVAIVVYRPSLLTADVQLFGAEGEGKGAFRGRILAVIIGGIIWGLWHAPLTCTGHNFGTDYPGFPYVGIARMCLFCTLIGIMLTFITVKSGSVWPAAIMHAVLNSGPSILNGYINTNLATTWVTKYYSGVWQTLVLIVLAAICLKLLSGKKVPAKA